MQHYFSFALVALCSATLSFLQFRGEASPFCLECDGDRFLFLFHQVLVHQYPHHQLRDRLLGEKVSHPNHANVEANKKFELTQLEPFLLYSWHVERKYPELMRFGLQL